ncbi:DUF2511 domain-containing protein [Streptomyces sp. NPDC005840]|uniref:DUF2511 domain-containing protein n=1 Tax=Streptomyces sp. NPDC005840 TaxID=3157072 RepID=UPI0033D44982
MGEGGAGKRPLGAGGKVAAFVVIVVAAICLSQCMGGGDGSGGTSHRAVDRHSVEAEAGDFEEWPFTVERGMLRCREGEQVTFTPEGGREYAVNGTAKAAGYPAMTPVWAEDPQVAALRADVTEVLVLGFALC